MEFMKALIDLETLAVACWACDRQIFVVRGFGPRNTYGFRRAFAFVFVTGVCANIEKRLACGQCAAMIT